MTTPTEVVTLWNTTSRCNSTANPLNVTNNATGVDTWMEPDDVADHVIYVVKWFRTLLIPLIVIGNGMTVIAIIAYSRMRTYTNAFIASLALTDVIIGAVFLPLFTLTITEGNAIYMQKWYCLTMVGPYYYTLYLQLFNLMGVATDRFIAIRYPFHYPTLVTRRTVTCVLVLVWFPPLAWPICFVLFWHRFTQEMSQKPLCQRGLTVATRDGFRLSMICGLWVCFLFMVVLYCCIFHTARKQIRKIHSIPEVLQDNQETKKKFKSLKADLKIARMALTVFAIFYLSYLPSTFVASLTWFPKFKDGNVIWIRILRAISTRMISLNSVLNPVAYVWSNRKFRAAFYCLIRGKSQLIYDSHASVSTSK